jgi:hypothetical protein
MHAKESTWKKRPNFKRDEAYIGYWLMILLLKVQKSLTVCLLLVQNTERCCVKTMLILD